MGLFKFKDIEFFFFKTKKLMVGGGGGAHAYNSYP